MTVNLSATPVGGSPLPADLDPATYRSHSLHSSERTWSETNCYVDLWIELLHAMGADPTPALAFALSAGFDGRQWDFVKFQPEDLRLLYGVDVSEMNIWKPFGEHLIENMHDGVLSTVEIDAFYLPDTDGTSYGREHTKTTIVPTAIDADARRLDYFHNAGLFRLEGDDFDGALARSLAPGTVALPPYVERVVVDRDALAAGPETDDHDLQVVRAHLERADAGNPVGRLGERVVEDVALIQQAGPDFFHLWSFGTLRQCGSTAELAADLAEYLERRGIEGAAAAAEPFREVASGAKSVQFRMARAARGRDVDVRDSMAGMAAAWQRGMDAVRSAL